ncbi:Crp/Fnr family transcriptional regulator [Sphingomonas sp. 35-24ZXX]|uniref:Crp/Fnr family transcriptional regulator n=1 Tax=Sphingomonas sp. 35-24ZXX TaxID=1545915 RepID=UPI00053BDD60|nr:Crp/Fnr family transcriptional regulator [Sphingomonas sp. 35-24ZXX]
MSDSCFVVRLNRYLALTAGEMKAVSALERDPKEYPSGSVLWQEGDDVSELLIVHHGWAHSETRPPNGKRQILRFHFSGDLIGAAGIAFRDAASSIVAATDMVVCRFPRKALGETFIHHPRLAALFFSMSQMESIDLADRLRAIGRSEGKARLANLFLSIAARMRAVSGESNPVVRIPLTQSDLGDAVGLTQVHVNRLIRQMTEEKLITRNRSTVTLLDEPRLIEISRFVDRFSAIDTSWFPAARA